MKFGKMAWETGITTPYIINLEIWVSLTLCSFGFQGRPLTLANPKANKTGFQIPEFPHPDYLAHKLKHKSG